MLQLAWIAGALVTALGITLDMHRLRIGRVGIPLTGWIAASACIGPIAGIVYLFRRRAVRRALIEAVWALVGGPSQPVHARRARLRALERSGLLGTPIYRECSALLDAETANRSSNVRNDCST